VTSAPAARTFEVRHLQLARAAIAAITAVMVTFSPDHSAAVGLAIFSGFAFLNALVLLIASRTTYPAGRRWPAVTLGVLSAIAGLAAGIAQLRTVPMFFVIVISWALATGIIETVAAARALRGSRRIQTADAARSESRDGLTIGILTIVLGIALLLVPTQYALQYTIDEADATFTLTGIIIAVGIFGGYAAIVAVYLAIAGFSPRKAIPAGGVDELGAAPTDRAPSAGQSPNSSTGPAAAEPFRTANDKKGQA